jgi:VanZ family protein
LKNQKSLFLFAIGWLAFVTILLCIPGTELPKVTWSTKIWLDKWVHIFLFLVLVWFWCRAYKSIEKIIAKKTFIAITVLSIFYGVIMEIIQQYFIPFRSFDVGDMIADSIGAIAGYFISIKRFLLKN